MSSLPDSHATNEAMRAPIEYVAVGTYDKALRNNMEYITAEQQTMLNAQHALIKADHDKVKAMRDALVEA